MIKKTIKKVISAVLTAAVAGTLMIGCGSAGLKSADASDPSKLDEVKLKMYLLGDKPKDFDEVYGKVNDIMKKKINATLDVNFVPWGDVDTKYQLLFQSGEDFDLIFTATGWAYYSQVATKNGFYELTDDMLKKYAPHVYESEPADAWKQAKINGKVYMVPQDKKELSYNVYGVRGDLMKKYGIDKIDNYADMEKYLDAAAKDSSLKYAVSNNGAQMFEMEWSEGKVHLTSIRGLLNMGNGNISFETEDKSGKVKSIVDSPEYLNYLKKMKEFAGKGYWAPDAISAKSTGDQDFVAGNCAIMKWNPATVATKIKLMNAAHPDWDARMIDLTDGCKKLDTPYVNNGMAINANSKNPERALMAIDLIRSDEELNNLVQYGIEGTHWEKADGGKYKELDDSSNYPAASACPWGFNTQEYIRTDVNQPEIVQKTIDKWEKNDVIDNPMVSFVYDDSKFKNEISAISNAYKQYGLPLELGMVDDIDAGFKQYRDKLTEAGYDKVLEDCQKQADKFIEDYDK